MTAHRISFVVLLLSAFQAQGSAVLTTMAMSDAEFADTILAASHRNAVIADFDAPWCGPCRAQRPMIEALARRYRDRVLVVRIDADSNAALMSRFRVRGLPSLFVFSDGVLIDRFTGQHSFDELKAIFARSAVR